MACTHPGWRGHQDWLACIECGEPMERYATVADLIAATRARLAAKRPTKKQPTKGDDDGPAHRA